MKLSDEIADLKTKSDSIKNRLKEMIKHLPENSKIQPINNIAYTMSIKDLENGILSPNYYRFSPQYEEVIAILDNVAAEEQITCLKNIVSARKAHSIKLHPKVIEYLKQIIAEE